VLAPAFRTLADAQHRCEQELLDQHPDAQFRWVPDEEPPTTSWRITQGASADFTTTGGYWVVIVGSDFDDGPRSF
jgi:hypothetical protein